MPNNELIQIPTPKQTWTNKSYVGEVEPFTWDEIREIALGIVNEYSGQRDYTSAIDSEKVIYHAAHCVLHTQPLDVETCAAYNLVRATLSSGEIMLFGDWCLYYRMSETEFVDKLKTDKELKFVHMFFDTLYSKLAIVGKMLNTQALKQYEASRGQGIFLPYEERAQIAENVSRLQALTDAGEDVMKIMLGRMGEDETI
jgi:hypothetical protein